MRPVYLPLVMCLVGTLGSAQDASQAQGSTPKETARPPQGDKLQAIELETVSVKAKREPFYSQNQSLGPLGDKKDREIPYSTNSIPQALIEDQQAKSLEDILRNDPSVSVNQATNTTSDFGAARFNIRGFTIDYSGVRVNGVNTFLATPPPEGIEGVDVLKGATSVLYGFGDPAGVINVRTKRPLDKSLTQVGLYSTLNHGQVEGAVDVSRRFGAREQFGVRVNLAKENGHGAVKGSQVDRDYEALAFDWKPIEGLRVFTDLSHSYNDRGGVNAYMYTYLMTSMPATVDPTQILGQPWSYEKTSNTLEQVGAEYKDSDWTAVVSVDHAHTNNKQFNTLGMGVANDGTYTVQPYGQRYQQNTNGLNALLERRFTLGPTNNELSVAYTRTNFTWGATGVITGAAIGTSNIYNPTYYPAPADPGSGATILYNSLWKYESKVFSEKMDIGSHWTASVGATHASYDTGPGGRYQQATTPMAAIIFKPISRVSIYASFIEALQLGAQAPSTAANAYAYLDPYRGKQKEIGVKAEILPGLELNSAYFIIDKDYPFLDPADNVYKSVGSQNNHGIELTLAGQICSNLKTFGGLMWQKADVEAIGSKIVTGPGNKVLGVPEWKGNLFAEYELPSVKGLTLMGGFNYVGARPSMVRSKVYYDMASYTTFDAGVKYDTKISAYPAKFNFYIQNLTNKAYWDGSTFSGMILYPGDPRTFKAQVVMKF